MARRFAPAFRALDVCEHNWPFSLRDVWATLLSPKWAEIFVAQMAGDETSLPRFCVMACVRRVLHLLSISTLEGPIWCGKLPMKKNLLPVYI